MLVNSWSLSPQMAALCLSIIRIKVKNLNLFTGFNSLFCFITIHCKNLWRQIRLKMCSQICFGVKFV